MTQPAKANRQQRVLKADHCLKDHTRELLILLELEEMAKKKIAGGPFRESSRRSSTIGKRTVHRISGPDRQSTRLRRRSRDREFSTAPEVVK